MKVFKDEQLNQKFLEEGYVIINLFNSEDCAEIKKVAESMVTDDFHNYSDFSALPNINTPDETCSIVHNFIKKISAQKLSKFLTEDYHFFYSTFLIKKPKSTSLMWHFDPSFYNQKENDFPFNVWGSVEETTSENGCFQLIPKSHKLAFDYEPLPFSKLGTSAKCKNLKDVYYQLIEKHAIDIPLKQGEVIIHNQSILHSSRPNNSDFKKRIAYKIVFIPKKIDNLELAYFNDINNHIDIYTVNKNKASQKICHYYEANYKSLMGKDDLIKSTVNHFNNLPFNTLKEMEKIMSIPNNSNKAKYTLIK